MFDMRAYIVSIIAVFLALAIGILLGTVVVDKGLLVEQQKSLVQRIQGQINELRDRNNELRKQVRLSDEFAARVFPDVLSNRLTGKRILLMAIPGAGVSLKKDLADAINAAGGNLSIMTINSNSLQLENQRVASQLLAYFPAENLVRKDYLHRIAQELATDLSGEKEFSFVNLLTNLNLILLEGAWPSKPDVIVVMGEEGRKTNSFLNDFVFPFIGKLKEANIPVVVTEPENSGASFIADYNKAGSTATVDNVDTIYGRISLIYALGGAKGNFGTKKTAERLLPPL